MQVCDMAERNFSKLKNAAKPRRKEEKNVWFGSLKSETKGSQKPGRKEITAVNSVGVDNQSSAEDVPDPCWLYLTLTSKLLNTDLYVEMSVRLFDN